MYEPMRKSATLTAGATGAAGAARSAGTGRAVRYLSIAGLLFAATLAACTPAIESRGSMVEAETLAKITPGVSAREDVSKILGAPSSITVFEPEAWLYIAMKTSTLAFFDTELLSRRVIYISFSEDGKVDEIGELSKADGKRIAYVDRETPTAGQKVTLIQQLIGNLGRFNQTQP